MNDLYSLVKVVHVVSATILFGTGLGTAFQMWCAHRSGNVQAIAAVARHVVWADFVFTTPAVIAQPVTGIFLIHLSGLSPAMPWLIATYVLYAVAGICWIPVVWIQIRIRDLALAAAAAESALSDRYFRLMRLWFCLGWPAFAGVLLIFWLMISKP